ncbi:MAG: glycosyltransferase [Gemmataceae bacterium]
MRILIMTNLYPNPFQPHRAAFNRQQVQLLAQHHAVSVIAPIAWTDELRARRSGAAPLPLSRRVELNGVPVEHPRFYFPPRMFRGLYGHCYKASVRRAFRRAVAGFRPEIIHTPWGYPDGWAAVELGHAVGLPVVIMVHGSDVLLLDQFPARRRRTVEALRKADGVIAVSEDIARRLASLGVARDRILMNHDGVDPALFRPGLRADARTHLGMAAGDPVVLFVGNLVPVKAIDVLLRAGNILVRGGFPVRIVAIGQGPLRSALERQAADLGLGARVRFAGTIPLTDLPNWYRAADVVCLPSHSEGVPNVLLEASACGVPWVASRVGGVPEIAGLGISRLVPPNDPDALAVALRAALSEPMCTHPPGPRDRRIVIEEMAAFLNSTLTRFRSGQ